MTSRLPKDVIEILLIDRSTNQNIVFAEPYEDIKPEDPITYEILTQKPQVVAEQYTRIKAMKSKDAKKAIVYTPQFAANNMLELMDIEYFDSKETQLFCSQQLPENDTDQREFLIDRRIPENCDSYINRRFLEPCCGESPFLVQRYHTGTGDPIEMPFRKGALDRKLHIIKKYLDTEDSSRELYFVDYVENAYESIYGYDLLGRQVFISRKNLVLTFIEFYEWIFKKQPPEDELQDIATIISYNIFQMNGLTYKVPIDCDPPIYAYVKDWNTGSDIQFRAFVQEDAKKPKRIKKG